MAKLKKKRKSLRKKRKKTLKMTRAKGLLSFDGVLGKPMQKSTND